MDIPFYFAFTAGAIAAFNPCGIAMFPAYVGFRLASERHVNGTFAILLEGFKLGTLLTLGFIVVFGFIGLLMVIGVRVVGNFLPFASVLTGIILIGLGIWSIVTKRNLFIAPQFLGVFGHGNDYLNTFLFGVAYAITSVSCALPIFMSAIGVVMGSNLSTDILIRIMASSLTYSLGMGAIMVAVTLLSLYFEELVSNSLNRVLLYFQPIGKIAMVIAGSYILWYWTFGSGGELLSLRFEQLFT